MATVHTVSSSGGGEVPLAAVWAGVAAVVIAAVIAAVAGHLRAKLVGRQESERLARQLEAEQERLNAQLRAEASRQSERLAHERELSDLEETRILVDEVIEAGEGALSATCEARLRFRASEDGRGEAEMARAKELLGEIGNKERRLRLRIGITHRVVDALVEYRFKNQALLNLVREAHRQGGLPSADVWQSGMGEVAAAQILVIGVGNETVGAILP
jgi:hypothetical protein